MRRALLALAAALFLFSCKKDAKVIKVDQGPTTVTFTIIPDSVKLNPTGFSPLAALVRFKSPIAGHTEIIVKGKHGAISNVTQSFTDTGTFHSIPILGLYADYTNTVTINVVSSKKDTARCTFNISTGLFPGNMPNYINTDVANVSAMESGYDLVSSLAGFPIVPFTPYMSDSFGDIRWYLDYRNHPQLNSLNYDCGVSRLKNGNYLFGDKNSDMLYEVDYFGKIVNTWPLHGYYFHHEVYEKPNGNFLVCVSKKGSTHTDGVITGLDFVIEVNRANAELVHVWDLKVSLNEYRRSLNKEPMDWIHVNGLAYDTIDNTIIVSGRVQGVFKISNNNRVKWVMGPHTGWGLNRRGEDLNQYLLKPLDANGQLITDSAVIKGTANAPDFEWNWYQHSPIIMPNGNIMIFDNGDIRNFNPAAPTHYSRAVEYKIDQTNMTIQQVWAYGEERKEETFSSIISSVQYLQKTNHVLFAPGYQVVNSIGQGGKIVEVDHATKNVVFQQSVSAANLWGFHRVLRMDLYPNSKPYF